MILNCFLTQPGFPFRHYFEDPSQFLAAGHYWSELLHSIEGFDPTAWEPRFSPAEMLGKMTAGTAVDLVSVCLKKAILIQTNSLEGMIDMMIDEEGPMDPSNLPKGLGDAKRAEIIAGTLHERVRQGAIRTYKPFEIWAERLRHTKVDPDFLGGFSDIWIERLVITAELSPESEAAAGQALELFLAKGSAIKRVNAKFWPDGPE